MAKEQKTTGLSREFIINPGETLAEVLEDREMNQKELAIRTGMTEKHVSTIVNGVKPISVAFAKKLEYALGIEAEFWMNLQSKYDCEILEFEEINNISEEELAVLKKFKEVMNLQIINREFSIFKTDKIDAELLQHEFVFISKTDNELSVICETALVPESAKQVEHDWSCFRIAENAAFEKYGMIAFLSKIIAAEKTGILVVATYDTDYILIKKNKLADVRNALEIKGCRFLDAK